MMEIEKTFKEREQKLLQIKEKAEESIGKAPVGTLRINGNGDKVQYYHRVNPKDVNGKYIREENVKFAYELAKKDYDKKVLHATEKELQAIHKYLNNYPKLVVEDIYENLHKERKKLVTPVVETQKEYIRSWESATYERKIFREDAPEFYTSRGERVRSKSEIIIADLLWKEKFHIDMSVQSI